MDREPVVEGKARMARGGVGDRGGLLQLRDECGERAGEVVQEREHLFEREQRFHHHEAHERMAAAAGVVIAASQTQATSQEITKPVRRAQ